MTDGPKVPPIIGVVLMIVVTVILAGVVASYFLGLGEHELSEDLETGQTVCESKFDDGVEYIGKPVASVEEYFDEESDYALCLFANGTVKGVPVSND